MYIFIFGNLEQVSDNYHAGGGLVVVAKSRKDVLKVIADDNYIKISAEEWKNVRKLKLSNETAKGEYWVMPDAGCC